jgi:hypothetical protein
LKGFFKNIQSLLIVVLVIIILIMRSCDGGGSTPTVKEPTTITKVEVRYDTIENVVIKYVPKWKEKIVTITDTIPLEIDTLAILKDYYAKYVYTDTLKLDTIGYAVINDTITRNTIFSRDVTTQLVIPTITQINTKYIYKREFFGGVSLGGLLNSVPNESPIQYISGELMYVNRKRNVYGLGLGIDNNFNPIISGRIYWKFGK